VDEVPGTEDLDLDGEEEDEGNDVRRMGRIWVKERGTVDIMQWEGDLIDTLFDKLEQQVSPAV
jgi:GINS complex subunit 4